MTSTYVVVGEAGEYSDYSMWPVRAFDSEAEATDEAKRLNEWVAAHAATIVDDDEVRPPGDPHGNGDSFYRPEYSVCEVPTGPWEGSA